MEDLKTPVLFGCKTAQRYILNVFLYGSMTKFSGYDRSSLSGTGIVRDAFVAGKQRAVCVLDERHPAHRDLVETMRTIAGGEARHFEAPPPSVPFAMDPEAPLGHRGRHAFRMLHRIATHGGEVSVERLRTEMADVWADSVNSNVAMLKRDGVLTEVGGVVRFAEGVPAAYVRAILKIGELLSRDDARLRIPDRVVSTPAAFCRSADGMPLLFGTDRRARNLMAVAKYGPMYWRDVRPLVGGVQNKLEDREMAPFGRGDVVRVWDTEHRPAVMMDPDYPLAEPLLRLLLKMEQFWPVAAYKANKPAPVPPPREPWIGDRFAVLGGPIKTQILATIAVLGWTFEALCCEVLKYDRVSVKKAIGRLEDKDKILMGDRRRGPGMNVRTLVIRDDFPAKAELMEFLRAFVEVHSDFGDRVRDKMARLRPKTREHLRKRGLL